MKKAVQNLAGLNVACLVRGLRLGPSEAWAAARACFAAAHPLEERIELERKKLRQFLEDSIPGLPLENILAGRKAAITLDFVKYEDGMLPFQDLLALASILAVEAPASALEIGTFMGYTTKAMATNLANATIHTIDLPLNYSEKMETASAIPKDDFHLIKRRVVGQEFAGQDFPCRIVQHFGDTATFDFQNFGKTDFFFIDGSHTYEYCRQDSEKCFALCRGRGVFLWHDCDESHPGVVRFVREWRELGRDIVRIEGTALAYWKGIP